MHTTFINIFNVNKSASVNQLLLKVNAFFRHYFEYITNHECAQSVTKENHTGTFYL